MSEHSAEKDAAEPCACVCHEKYLSPCSACLAHAQHYDTDPALPSLLAEARKARPTCRLGPTEHDGSRFCHEHTGRVHAGSATHWRCDKAEGVSNG